MSKQYVRLILLLSTLSHHYGIRSLQMLIIRLIVILYPQRNTGYIFSVVMSTTPLQHYNVAEVPPFDTDSQLVGVDNRCSACITSVRADIPGEIVACNRSIRGFGGAKVWNVWMGTIKWDIEGDEGVTHTHIIPKSYYVPQGHVRLLSPQHWAQSRTGIDKRGGAGTTTTVRIP